MTNFLLLGVNFDLSPTNFGYSGGRARSPLGRCESVKRSRHTHKTFWAIKPDDNSFWAIKPDNNSTFVFLPVVKQQLLTKLYVFFFHSWAQSWKFLNFCHLWKKQLYSKSTHASNQPINLCQAKHLHVKINKKWTLTIFRWI